MININYVYDIVKLICSKHYQVIIFTYIKVYVKKATWLYNIKTDNQHAVNMSRQQCPGQSGFRNICSVEHEVTDYKEYAIKVETIKLNPKISTALV